MTLSHSRHQYAELVFDQSIGTWTRLHVAAFEFFGGTPRRLVIDNLKAAIVRAALYDPEVQRSYRDLCEHYDVVVSPCRPATPQHKGKVEKGGVHYVKRNALAGRSFRDINEANVYLQRWCLEVAGRRVHGTTQCLPLKVFEQAERAALKPLPRSPWEFCEWQKCKLHRDCHIVFDRSYYSGPHRLVGRELMVRATDVLVQLFYEHKLVATHARATAPGQRKTLEAHLPPDKVAFIQQHPDWCRARAAEIGPSTARFVAELLDDRPLDRLRSAQNTLRLCHKYGPRRLEAACARALAHGELRYETVKRILKKGLDLEPSSSAQHKPADARRPRHARQWNEFFPAAAEQRS